MKILNSTRQYRRVLELFDRFNEQNIDQYSNWTIIQVLKACTEARDVQRGLKLHDLISSRLKHDRYVLPSLIHFYMQCNDVSRAELLFSTETKKSLIMYGAMMKGYIVNRTPKKAIDLFKSVRNPDHVLVTLFFNACAQLGTNNELQLIKIVQSNIPKAFLSSSTVLCSLIDALGKCGDMESAESVFCSSTRKTPTVYGAMMKSYIIHKVPEKAIDLFNTIHERNEILIILFFNACAQLGNDKELQLINNVASNIPKSFHTNVYVLTSLIDAFLKCSDVKSAELVFASARNKTLEMYGVLMKGYISNNMPYKAIEVFNSVHSPDEILVSLLFNACAELGTDKELKLVKTVASNIPKTFHTSPYILTSFIDALSKCRNIKEAELIFYSSPIKTETMHGALMKGYILNGMPEKAISLFNTIDDPNEVIISLFFNACSDLGTDKAAQLVKAIASNLPKEFHSNTYVKTSLIDALVKCGDVQSAESIFRLSTPKTLLMYGAMMTGFNQNKDTWKAIALFNDIDSDKTFSKNAFSMLSDEKNRHYKANVTTWLCLIKVLAQMGMFEKAKSFVQRIPNIYLSDHRIQGALIDMWGKVDAVDQAKRIFQNMSEPDGVAYTAMINSYGLSGMGFEAVELFRQMPEHLIMEPTHVCILNACSHSGLADEARSIFNRIQVKTVKIFTAMVDCLSRIAAFDEARRLIEDFECCNAPSIFMYMSLLSGARNNKNSKLAQHVFNRMQELFPEMKSSLTSASILLANVYASSGAMQKATDIKTQLNVSGARKKMGLSYTEFDGKIWMFRAHDRSFPYYNELCIEIERMSKELSAHGHEYDASWITRPIEYDETIETVLCGHSERLAIAANFLFHRKPKRIQITKNLRVCGECHKGTKLIALIRQCLIVVRDANRIHHFHPNGQCSCQDQF